MEKEVESLKEQIDYLFKKIISIQNYWNNYNECRTIDHIHYILTHSHYKDVYCGNDVALVLTFDDIETWGYIIEEHMDKIRSLRDKLNSISEEIE